MFRRNQEPTPLFRKDHLETYLANMESTLRNKIDKYNDHTLLSIDIEKDAKGLVKSLQLKVPKFIKQDTDTSISKAQITGYQFPPGRSFVPGKIYDIEIVNYTVPFSGSNDFFKYLPKGFQGREIIADLNLNNVTFKLTNYDTISGNDTAIEILKTQFLVQIGIVEQYLEAVKNEVEHFENNLEQNVLSYLTKRKEAAVIKSDSKDKLNPFK